MRCYIYCLYSTEDGEPRYVGRASDRVSYRYGQHVTAALEKEPGALYDWMRDVWRRDHDVWPYTLQEGVIPEDLDMFERYWIEQFPSLLDVSHNKSGKSETTIATQIRRAIKDHLQRVRTPPGDGK
jgi:hypothetical protein